ncbi:RsmE family RNA methyltransferase [bacterium]|nr:RsmE family RNA methyltransferase [bacterium]
MMPRFFDPALGASGGLDEDEARHALKVLRLGTGSEIELCDGRGGLARAVLADAQANFSVLQSEQHPRITPGLTVAMAPTKQMDRVEWAVEKLAEMGVDRFVPLLTTRTERGAVRTDRLERIALSALKQSRSLFLMEIAPLTPLNAVLEQFSKTQILLAHCAEAPKTPLSDVPLSTDTVLLIGPEGDFTPEEIALALDRQATGINLGPRRLRTETAALYGSAVLLGSRR